jgi:hypothetical protein
MTVLLEMRCKKKKIILLGYAKAQRKQLIPSISPNIQTLKVPRTPKMKTNSLNWSSANLHSHIRLKLV